MGSEQRWRKLPYNPILPCVDRDVWDRDPTAPHALRVGDRLRMYYGGQQDDPIRIGIAEASPGDPLSWEKHPGNPVLDLGPEGAIDSHWIAYPWVVPITESHWHMYHATWGGEYRTHEAGATAKVWGTSLARIDDAGWTWTRTGRPLFQLGRSGAPDEHATGSCCVLKVGPEYWMWYTAICRPYGDWYRISTALATSTDGGHTFTPHPAGAVLNLPPTTGSPGSVCSKPFVDHREGIFRMWFSCVKDGLPYRIHYAESRDGIHFSWRIDPVVDVSASGWDQEMTCYPSLLFQDNRTLIFYDGNAYAGVGAAELVEG